MFISLSMVALLLLHGSNVQPALPHPLVPHHHGNNLGLQELLLHGLLLVAQLVMVVVLQPPLHLGKMLVLDMTLMLLLLELVLVLAITMHMAVHIMVIMTMLLLLHPVAILPHGNKLHLLQVVNLG